MSASTQVPLKRLFNIVNGSTPTSSEPDYWDGEICWATPEDIGKSTGQCLTETSRKITEEGYRSCGTSMVAKGSLVLTTRAPVGNIVIAGVPLCTNQGCKSLEPLDKGVVNCEYFYYLLGSKASELNALARGSTFVELGTDQLGAYKVRVPPIVIQRQIVDILNAETADLDALIGEKQRLLKLLSEKRRAVIADFLTKGLNKDAPRRDSEIPWLGEIPAHWQTFPIRRLIRSLEQGWSPVASNLPAEPEEFGVLKLSAIKNGRFLPDENKALSPDAEVPADLSICEDDVFITRANTPKLVGDVALSERHYSNLIFSDLIYRLKIDTRKALPAWTVLALLSDIGRTQIESEAKGSSGSMVKLSQDQVLDIVLPVPPLEEQQAIVQRVQDEIRKLDALAEATERTITLLQERRSALISAAVTGEIEIGEATI